MERTRIVLLVALCLLSALPAGAEGKQEGAKPQAERSVTLRFTTWAGPTETNSIEAQLRRWRETQPGVKITWEGYPFAQYEPKLKTLFAAGQEPDVLWIAPLHGPRSFMAKGVLKRLDPLLSEADKATLRLYRPGILANCSDEKGNLYFMPFLGDNSILYFNKDLFDKSGIAHPPRTWAGDPNWDWNKFLEVALKLTKDTNGDGSTDIWGYSDHANSVVIEIYAYLLGRAIIPPGAHEVFIDSPEGIGALQSFTDLRLKYRVSPQAMNMPGGGTAQDLFFGGTGKLGMGMFWSASAPRYPDVPFKWGLAQVPSQKNRGGELGTRAWPLPTRPSLPATRGLS